MTPPWFITLEGGEGVGKSTAMAWVSAWLHAHGHAVIETREPGGTALGEAVRAALLTAYAHPTTELSELLLIFGARAQHLAEVVRPALARGTTVVCDRFTDATYAYQGGGRGLASSTIAMLEQLVHGDLTPNLTLLLDAAPDITLARRAARGASDRFERESAEFFARVRASYLARARQHAERIELIDAGRSPGEVRASIVTALERHLA